MSKLIEEADLSYDASGDNVNATDPEYFDAESVEGLTEDELTDDFLLELHSLVGIDAVNEFGFALKKYNPDMFDIYVEKLFEYYLKRQKDLPRTVEFE